MARHEGQEDTSMDRETASEMSVDNLMSQLLDMGFEISDCKDALAVGKFNIEDAIEWLLKARPSLTSQGPILRLKQHSSSQFDSGGWVTPLESLSSAENSVSSLGIGESSALESESETKVSSRLAESANSRSHFEDRMKREVEQLARQERMEKKKAREVVLLQIAQDKADKKKNTSSVTNLQFGVETSSLSSGSSNSIKSAKSTELNESRLDCLLQIRCPDGQTLKQNFSQAETLVNVWDFLQSQLVLSNDMMLMQPFPKREFTREDQYKTLKELKLVPSSSLILQQSTPVVQLQGTATSSSSDIQSTGDATERIEPQHIWGRGLPLDTAESDVVVPNSSTNENDSMDTVEDIIVGHPAEEPVAMNPLLDNPLAAQLHLWGSGSRLGGTVELGGEWEETSHVTEQAGAAARNRAQVVPAALEEPAESLFVQYPLVPTLSEQCLKLVVRRLQEPQPTLSLNLPSHIAERILQHMMKEKVLRPLMVQHFRTCRIQRLNLDYYPYATNELLQAFRYHTSLQQISLVSCPLIGDGGLQKLKSLKRLQLLNLRGCTQITDNCFSVISEYPSLNTLNLEGTKITDDGLRKFLSVPRPSLQRLSLGRTNVTHHCLPCFKNFPNLIFLSLDGTKVATLTSLPAFPSLESFSVQGTDIPTEDLACLRNFPKLTSLNIGDTPNINGDEGLELLSGIHLLLLQFPSRTTTTDAGLRHITGLPLTSVDLTNYNNVGDKGIAHLAVIKSLRQLHLSNTKLTDTGILALKDLSALEVLYVDRTAVTDVGAVILENFAKLQELSMASTRIKGRFISAGILNHCKLLTKLNLSRTKITTKVLKSLVLPNLVLLNVDGTRLSVDPTGTLTGCARLRHVSAKNLRPPHPLNDSDSD